MQTTTTNISGLLILAPRIYEDPRGYFTETFRQDIFENSIGQAMSFPQDNHSYSKHKHTVRGLHFQGPAQGQSAGQGKLVRCTRGQVLDVAVDIRKNSPTYGQHVKIELSADNHKQFWIPPGFLHGFISLEPNCEVQYKCTHIYAPECEGIVRWNDLDLAIDWGVDAADAHVSQKDAKGQKFSSFQTPFTADLS